MQDVIHKALEAAVVEARLAMWRVEERAALAVIDSAAGIVQRLPWEGAAGAQIAIERLGVFLHLKR